jgi:hypothetical protein
MHQQQRIALPDLAIGKAAVAEVEEGWRAIERRGRLHRGVHRGVSCFAGLPGEAGCSTNRQPVCF